MSDEVRHARALIEVGRWEQAQQVLGRFLAGAPESAEALCLLARSHQLARRYEPMLAAADRAVAVSPSAEWGHRLRSIALGKLRRLADSETAARRAVQLAPNAWQPYVILVDALLALGTPASRRDAFGVASRAAALAPGEPEVHNSRGRVFQAISDPAAARRCYQHALTLDPQNPTAQNNLAIVELRRGKTTAAGRRLGDVLAQRPTEPLYQENARATAKVWAYRLMDLGTLAFAVALGLAVANPPRSILFGSTAALLAGYALVALLRYRRLSPALRRLIRGCRPPLLGAVVQAIAVLVIGVCWYVDALAVLLLLALMLAAVVSATSLVRCYTRTRSRLIRFIRRWWYRLVVLKEPG